MSPFPREVELGNKKMVPRRAKTQILYNAVCTCQTNKMKRKKLLMSDDPMLFFEIVNPFYIEKSRVNIVFTFQQEAGSDMLAVRHLYYTYQS